MSQRLKYSKSREQKQSLLWFAIYNHSRLSSPNKFDCIRLSRLPSFCKILSARVLQNSIPFKWHTVLQWLGNHCLTRQGSRLVCCQVHSCILVILFRMPYKTRAGVFLVSVTLSVIYESWPCFAPVKMKEQSIYESFMSLIFNVL